MSTEQAEIRHALKLITAPNSVVELRVPKAGRFKTVSGYYNDLDKLAHDAAQWSGQAPGVYITLNPVQPALLARAANRCAPYAENTTKDEQIERRQFLFIDADAIRPAGISATDEEHAAALERAHAVSAFLRSLDFSEPIIADSGNGGHVLCPIDLPNTPDTTDLLRRCLSALAFRFDDARVKIDPSTYNASRINKLYGTLAAKGDNTPERPHRLASLISVPTVLEVTPRDVLERLAATLPPEPPKEQPRAHGGAFDVESFFTRHGLGVASAGVWNGARKWALRICPFNPAHDRGEFYVLQYPGGVIVAGCLHQTCRDCSGQTWREMRAMYEPHQDTTRVKEAAAEEPDTAPLKVVRMADVQAEIVSWLWHPYIALGKLTILEGDPGLGKSWLTCALACAVSHGARLPNAEPFTPGNVLMLSAEDGLGDTLRPRLDAVGADVSRVFALDEPLTFDAGGLLKLEAAIIEHAPLLVIIDPLFAFTGGKVDIHRANECRAISAPLAAIAERQGCAVVAVRHLGKSRGGGHALNAGIGSIDFAAAARSVLLVGRDPDDEMKRAVVQTKNNLAPHGPAIGYTLEGGCFYWTGESDLTAGRILAAASDEEERSTITEAVDFLRTALSGGARDSKAVKAEARDGGISEATLRRAQKRLNARAKKVGVPGSQDQKWVWELLDAEGAQPRAEDVQKTDGEHLRANEPSKDSYGNNLAEGAQGSEFERLRASVEHLREPDEPLDDEAAERAAIMEHDGGLPPEEAERLARPMADEAFEFAPGKYF